MLNHKPRAIDVPPPVRDGSLLCVVSLSGGKDSTATALALREAGVPFRLVFADTGWEAPETYEHLEMLERQLGPIARVGYPGGMVARIRVEARFASRRQRWCTRDLKIIPLREWHDALERAEGIDTVCVVGIRGQESSERAAMPVWEDDAEWGGWMWRPLISWSIEDVLAIHHRHNIPVNPLYQRGHSRVGCFPCINANKEDVRLLAEYAPERVSLIRDLEAEVTAERARRNAERPGRYEDERATFFRSDVGPMPIDDMATWARTERGGRQLPMFPADPTGGCFRWGMCEPPTEDDK